MRRRKSLKHARKVLGDHVDRFYLSLGAFVSAFSSVETTLMRALWVLAHIEPPYAQAVLSGVRIEGAMGYINRIAEAEQWSDERKAEWKRLFDQLGLLNKLRNDLLHHGAAIFGNVWVVSNERVVHHATRRREIHITPKILDRASDDLGQINTALMLLGGERMGHVYSKRGRLRKPRRRAWRYKPPPQADWLRTMNELLQKHERQPRPSRK